MSSVDLAAFWLYLLRYFLLQINRQSEDHVSYNMAYLLTNIIRDLFFCKYCTITLQVLDVFKSHYSSINKDAYGHTHLQDPGGSDLSTRACGDKIFVGSKLDLYSERILHCTSVGNVAAMTNDATNGGDAIIVATTPDGLPAQGIPLSGDFFRYREISRIVPIPFILGMTRSKFL